MINLNCAWEHLLSENHAEVALSDKACKNAQKWSDRQDN